MAAPPSTLPASALPHFPTPSSPPAAASAGSRRGSTAPPLPPPQGGLATRSGVACGRDGHRRRRRCSCRPCRRGRRRLHRRPWMPLSPTPSSPPAAASAGGGRASTAPLPPPAQGGLATRSGVACGHGGHRRRRRCSRPHTATAGRGCRRGRRRLHRRPRLPLSPTPSSLPAAASARSGCASTAPPPPPSHGWLASPHRRGLGRPPVSTVRRAGSAEAVAVAVTAVAAAVSRAGHGAREEQPRAESADDAASAERAGDSA